MPELHSNFSAADWGIVAVYLLGTILVGVYARKHIKNMADYLVAGRALRSRLAVATMIGSELGLITVMYAAQKGFTGGFAALHIALIAGFVTLLVGLTGFIVVPLREMGVMTIPEFYERRFSRGVRVLGGIVLAAGGILNMGLFLKAGASFVIGLTGMEPGVEVKLVMSGLLVLVLIYTMLGGMVSVVITDYVQFVVLSIGLLVAVGFGIHAVGWSAMIDTVRTTRQAAGFDPFHGDGFGWSYVVWMFFVAGLISCAVWPTAVMRACAAESATVVRRMYVWSAIGFLARFMIPNLLGICAFCYLANQSEALRDYFVPADGSPGTEASLLAMPVFLSQILPVGVIGLIGAGMLAAFMSTHDSYLLCWSAVLTQDVCAPLFAQRLSSRGRILVTRLFIAGIGAFLLIWSLWYPLRQDLWDYMAVTGAVYFTGGFAVLVLGLYWRRATSTGAYAALCTGGLALFGLPAVREYTGLAGLAERWGVPMTTEGVGLATAAACLAVMVVGSLLSSNTSTGETPA